MRPWLVPPRRTTEAVTPEQLVATGALGGSWGVDPIDGDRGYRPAGTIGGREIPWWTAEKARAYAVNAYRANPMAKAIIDTFTAFCVGDSGVSYQVTNPEVRAVVDQFWQDPKNQLADRQELMLRSHLLRGESLLEMLVGQMSGVVRMSPIETGRIDDVQLRGGNAWWPIGVTLDVMAGGDGGRQLSVVEVNDFTGLREGKAMFWTSFKALDTDIRGFSFLGPILDQLDSYDTVLSNLIDRTALARYMVHDVTLKGADQSEIDAWVAARGGLHVPPSGSVEVHNDAVEWKPYTVQSGAEEDSVAARSVLTQVAAGAGLAKTWLAEPDDANRATSLTMAEPVRRRVGGVQNMWVGYMAELTRFQVDRAVAAKRLAATVSATDPRTGQTYQIPAAQAVTVTGPEIAAAYAQLTASVLLNLSTALENMVMSGVLSPEAAKVAARKAWEGYMGVPYTAELDSAEANPDDVATAIDDAQVAEAKRRKGGHGNARQLKSYWTKGEGLAKWADTPHPFTALLGHLAKYMDEDEAKRTAATWYHDVKGTWPGAHHGNKKESISGQV
jgi:hypothetical protein